MSFDDVLDFLLLQLVFSSSYFLETCINTIIPLVMKFCEGALQDEDSTLPVVSKHLGKLCHGLSSSMSASQRSWFLDYYKKLCSMGLRTTPSLNSDQKRANDINDNSKVRGNE